MFVCLFVFCVVFWGCYVPFENWIFHVTITGERLQLIFAYTRHSWSWAVRCDTGYPFTMVISEYLWHSNLLPSVNLWSCHYLFLQLRSVHVAAGIRNIQRSACGANALTDCATAAVIYTSYDKCYMYVLTFLHSYHHPYRYQFKKIKLGITAL